MPSTDVCLTLRQTARMLVVMVWGCCGGEAYSLYANTLFLVVARKSGGLTFGEILMKNFASKVNRFLKSEDGPTAVEYAVMLALIIVVCLGAITSVGSNANSTFNSVANQL